MKPINTNPCNAVPDCTEGPIYGNGMCHFHWQRKKDGVPFDKPRKTVGRKTCSLGCDKYVVGFGYCSTHYGRFKRTGSPHKKEQLVGPDHPNWTGGVHVGKDGYVKRTIYPGDSQYPEGKSGRVRVNEHRYVMGNHLGRVLLPEENVHHINGNKEDNRIENLELWSTSQPKGQRVEDKLAWARELIEQYEHLSH